MSKTMKDFVNQYLTNSAVISVTRLKDQYRVRYIKDGTQYETTVPFIHGHDNQVQAIVDAIGE